jgi:hypothetical protein
MRIALGLCGSLLLIAGLLLYAAGWVCLWSEAFKQSLVWGLLVFMVPPFTIVFAFGYWRTAKVPSLSLLIGVGFLALGYFLILASGIPIPDH